MSLLANSNAIEDAGYKIQRSLRFRSSASAYLSRTPASAGNRKTWTWSGWVKRGTLGATSRLFSAAPASPNKWVNIGFASTDVITVSSDGATTEGVVTSAVYRDPSAWYHIVVAFDVTDATAANRVKIYVNGVQQTISASPAYFLNQNYAVNDTVFHGVGALYDGATYYYSNLYLTEVNFIDGQALTPSSFGQTDPVTGVWTPKKYTGTYGTNGFYLNFSDNSAATPAGLGKDYSGMTGNVIVGTSTSGSTTLSVVSLTGISVGNIVTGPGIPANTYVVSTGVLSVTLSQAATSSNISTNYTFSGNNWTPNNISTTAGATYDSMTDVPTLTSATAANYAVLNPLEITTTTKPTNGNLTYSPSATNPQIAISTIEIPSTGKWYAEFTKGSTTSGWTVGIVGPNRAGAYTGDTGSIGYFDGGQFFKDATQVQSGLAVVASGDVVAVAVDSDAKTVQFYKNNSAVGTSVSYTYAQIWFACGNYFNGLVFNANFGQRPFSYTPPTGFKALNTFNLPDPTIKKPNQYMDATLYTGTGASQNITNAAGFQPDFVWAKSRSGAESHRLYDSVRGATNSLYSNLTNAEATETQSLTAFNGNGFALGTGAPNTSTVTYVGWQWKKGATPGFDIVTYTGNGTAQGRTISHSLGVTPAMIINKARGTTNNWNTWHKSLGTPSQSYLSLNLTDAAGGDAYTWGNTAPNSTAFGVGWLSGGAYTNQNGINFVAYLFAEIAGFSKFGSYTGNGSTDGPFVYCGFRPKYVMMKASSTTSNWELYDSSRDPYNTCNAVLYANTSGAEPGAATALDVDILSNGFKWREGGGQGNDVGVTYIFAAFAENPFKYSLAR